MTSNILYIFSAISLVAFVLLVAAWAPGLGAFNGATCQVERPWRPKFKAYLPLFLAILTFFHLPIGAGPPFIDVAFGGAGAFGFLWAAQLISPKGKFSENLIHPFNYGLVLAVLAWLAWGHAAPGPILNLATFRGLNWFEILSPVELCGFILLAVGTFLSLRALCVLNCQTLTGRTRQLAWGALWLAFFPFNISPRAFDFLSIEALFFVELSLHFYLFWLNCLLLVFLAKIAPKIQIPTFLAVCLTGVGATILLVAAPLGF
ncbi:MAG: hypothetical protein ACRCTY_02535 [Candidatus Adiutrix sp.]